MDADVAEAKRIARARVRAGRRARRDHPDAEARRADDARLLGEALLTHPASRVACVAVFEPLPTEPPLTNTTAALLARGTRVLVPHLLPDLDLDWRELGDARDAPLLGLDAIGAAGLVLVPALAVDAVGTRLGQGGGSYDRALTRRSPSAVVCAVVHDDELFTETLPRDGHDEPVHAALTPHGGWTPLPSDPSTWDNRSG